MGMKQRVLLVLPHPGIDNFAESLVRTLTEYDFKILAFNARGSSSFESVWQEPMLTRLSGLEWRNLPFHAEQFSQYVSLALSQTQLQVLQRQQAPDLETLACTQRQATPILDDRNVLYHKSSPFG